MEALAKYDTADTLPRFPPRSSSLFGRGLEMKRGDGPEERGGGPEERPIRAAAGAGAAEGRNGAAEGRNGRAREGPSGGAAAAGPAVLFAAATAAPAAAVPPAAVAPAAAAAASVGAAATGLEAVAAARAAVAPATRLHQSISESPVPSGLGAAVAVAVAAPGAAADRGARESADDAAARAIAARAAEVLARALRLRTDLEMASIDGVCGAGDDHLLFEGGGGGYAGDEGGGGPDAWVDGADGEGEMSESAREQWIAAKIEEAGAHFARSEATERVAAVAERCECAPSPALGLRATPPPALPRVCVGSPACSRSGRTQCVV